MSEYIAESEQREIPDLAQTPYALLVRPRPAVSVRKGAETKPKNVPTLVNDEARNPENRENTQQQPPSPCLPQQPQWTSYAM